MAKLLSYIFSRQFLHDCAALFTVGAFLLAAYAVVYPAAVSDYLDEIARNTEIGNAALKQIQGSSEQTSENTSEIREDTSELVRAISQALLIQIGKENEGRCVTNCELWIGVLNITPYRFSDVQLTVFSTSGSVLSSYDIGWLFPEAGANYGLLARVPIGRVCVSYTDAATGIKLFDSRIAGDFSRDNELMFTGGDFGEARQGNGC